MKIYSAGASFGLHAIVIAMLLHDEPIQKPPPSLTLAMVAMNDGILVSPNDIGGSCPGHTYFGIGIRADEGGFIIQAPPGYPAYDAGIRVGDEPDFNDDTKIAVQVVEVIRNDVVLSFEVKSTVVCLK